MQPAPAPGYGKEPAFRGQALSTGILMAPRLKATESQCLTSSDCWDMGEKGYHGDAGTPWRPREHKAGMRASWGHHGDMTNMNWLVTGTWSCRDGQLSYWKAVVRLCPLSAPVPTQEFRSE